MKMYKVFGLVLAALLLVPCHALAAGPKMALSAESWNLGEIYQWTNPSIEITVKNTGDQDLKVLDVRAACGCTAAVISDKVIKPGAAGKLRIEFASYNFTGEVRKEVVLLTNDPGAAEKHIAITGKIRPDKAAVGALEPDYLDLGVIAPYETRYFYVTVRNKGNMDLKVTGLQLPAGCFLDSAVPDNVTPRGTVPIRIGYKPARPSGPVEGEVRLQTAGANQNEFKTRLAGYVAGKAAGTDALIITPTVFKVYPGSPNPVLEIAVKNGGAGEVILEGAESSFEGVGPAGPSKPELAPGEAGTISLPLKPEALKPDTKGYVYIRVAVPVIVSGDRKK